MLLLLLLLSLLDVDLAAIRDEIFAPTKGLEEEIDGLLLEDASSSFSDISVLFSLMFSSVVAQTVILCLVLLNESFGSLKLE